MWHVGRTTLQEGRPCHLTAGCNPALQASSSSHSCICRRLSCWSSLKRHFMVVSIFPAKPRLPASPATGLCSHLHISWHAVASGESSPFDITSHAVWRERRRQSDSPTETRLYDLLFLTLQELHTYQVQISSTQPPRLETEKNPISVLPNLSERFGFLPDI